jgi:hypothetical protein
MFTFKIHPATGKRVEFFNGVRCLSNQESDLCYLARRLRRAGTNATVRKIERQAGVFLPTVHALVSALEKLEREDSAGRLCIAVADRLAVESVIGNA